MRPKREWSLRLRLSLFFAVLLLAAWTVAAFCSWRASVEHINAFFDTQQMLFAKRLAAARYATITEHLPDTDDMLAAAGRGDEGEQEDDSLAFAVFSPGGQLLLSDGDEGKRFVFTPKANGFVDTRIKGDWWRIVWLTSMDRKVIVAVGQEREYRDDMAFAMLAGQMLPWLVLLPVLLLGLMMMLSRELAPLRSVAASLGRRDPNDTTPIAAQVQSEVRPLVQALNSLFSRIGDMLRRERVFIANAAHELRTPLAGLSIQAQVAHSAKTPETRAHALAQLRKGISRTSRLVDQLLMLSKLESPDAPDVSGAKDGAGSHGMPRDSLRWGELVENALEEAQGQIEAKNITLSFHDDSGGASILGQRELLDVLLRNVVGNAVAYTPEAGVIDVRLDARGFTMWNSSGTIAAADAARLGERFFRPPGQGGHGSGLGLSIVKRIAQIHGLGMHVSAESGRFAVVFTFPA
ncbi:sensory histidine kinase in two-component regulatory system with QseB [uncultured delta proteobacterium]|uniref:histidine kinase n=1 Tax=uncultured delta proteobacterium TaxID=34034 RepID=A0A212IVS8_9DELT|nr:sensory histidine kinase in two-component regulatory system with QseB [uncultured delta proteobacterium]